MTVRHAAAPTSMTEASRSLDPRALAAHPERAPIIRVGDARAQILLECARFRFAQVGGRVQNWRAQKNNGFAQRMAY